MDILILAGAVVTGCVLYRYHAAQTSATLCGCPNCRRELESWEEFDAVEFERNTPVGEPAEREQQHWTNEGG